MSKTLHIPGVNCPPEIARLAKKARKSSDQRSYMFESWLAANEDWKSSTLLTTLRNKNVSSYRGVRKWMLFSEMKGKWGEEIATAMKESKESDEERAKNEIRDFPEVPNLQQYLCLCEDSEENLEQEEFEMVFSTGADDSDSSSSEQKDKKTKKKKKANKKNKKSKKDKVSSPSPAKRKNKGKGKGKGGGKKNGQVGCCILGFRDYRVHG